MDLLINAALIASSVVLLCYWFRYGCLLILAAEAPHDYTEEVADVNQLAFLNVRSKLREHDVSDLDSLHKCLKRDFAIIAYLLRHTSTDLECGLENAMLKIHFRAMSAFFHVTRGNLHELASDTLEEMTLVVAYFVNQMGERNAAFASPTR